MFHGAGLPGVNRFHLCGKGGQGPADADTADPAGKLPGKGAVAELLVGSDMLRRLEGTVPEKSSLRCPIRRDIRPLGPRL